MRDIRASAEVQAFLGVRKLRELHADAFASYECWECGRAGKTTEPTSVIVLANRVFRVVKLAHAACADSQIIEADDAGIGAMADKLLRRHAASRPQYRADSFVEARAINEGVPGMKKVRLARRLGLDANPLRRRIDRAATCLGALLLAVFLTGAPLLSVAAVGWAARAAGTEQQATHFWHDGPAVGKARLAGGYKIPLWDEWAHSRTNRPLTHRAVLAVEATSAVAATCALVIVLLCLVSAGRWVLDRRRLAAWEAAWATVGPQWTKRFRSRG